MLFGLHVEHELGERAVQTRRLAAQEGEARARQPRAGVEVHAERRAEIDMVARREAELTGCTPAADLDVRLLVDAERHAVVRQVRHRHQQRVELGLDHVEPLGRRLQLVADAAHFGHHRRAVFTLRLQLADLLGQAVAPRLQLLGAGLQGLALGFERLETRDVQKGLRRLALVEPRNDAGQILAQQVDVEHGRRAGTGPQEKCVKRGL
jgi:hypothetical protein